MSKKKESKQKEASQPKGGCPLKVGSLFSGIGGLELGLEWAGMETVWQVEYESYCQKVLSERWPNVKRYGDIYEVEGTELERVDVICGGFPCQPFSQAGKRKGTADSRWLWPGFYRIVCEVRPRWVVIENVPGLLSIDAGRVFAGILRDLANAGYNAEWRIVSAADVGARHLRKRVFIVAHAEGEQGTPQPKQPEDIREKQVQSGGGSRESGIFNDQILAYLRARNTGPGGIWEFDPADVPDTDNNGQFAPLRSPGESGESEETTSPELGGNNREGGIQSTNHLPDPSSEGIGQETRDVRREGALPSTDGQRLWNGFDTDDKGEGTCRPAPPRMGIMADGLPGAVDYGNQARVGLKIEERVNRLKALGNAVVPQVAEYVGQCIVRASQPKEAVK